MINTIRLGGKYSDKELALNALSKIWDPKEALKRIPQDIFTEALEISISQIDARIRSGSSLSLVESFSGMLRVVAGTNSLMRTLLFPEERLKKCQMKGAFFLTRMAAKEQYQGLTPEEIAGLAMGGMIDLVYTPNVPELSETSGMGADRGWEGKTVKTINASTLSALVLAALGYPTTKHGSYGNTTRVGSTDVPEQFGARINQSTDGDVLKVLRVSGFWFNDAHAVKTIHYLSHLLMVETINHIVGPMTAPIASQTRLYKLMGVNHYVHPETIAKSYVILHKLGVVNLGGAVILSGVRTPPDHNRGLGDHVWFEQSAYLDEVSVGLTLVSCAKGENFLGTFLIDTCRQLGLSIPEESVKVPNEINTLMRANQQALKGQNPYAEYLALNSAFALATHGLGEEDLVCSLSAGFERTLSTLKSGEAFNTLLRYVEVTGGNFRSWE
jgi:anthranilate phosphoribosyltransferase